MPSKEEVNQWYKSRYGLDFASMSPQVLKSLDSLESQLQDAGPPLVGGGYNALRAQIAEKGGIDRNTARGISIYSNYKRGFIPDENNHGIDVNKLKKEGIPQDQINRLIENTKKRILDSVENTYTIGTYAPLIERAEKINAQKKTQQANQAKEIEMPALAFEAPAPKPAPAPEPAPASASGPKLSPLPNIQNYNPAPGEPDFVGPTMPGPQPPTYVKPLIMPGSEGPVDPYATNIDNQLAEILMNRNRS